MHRQALHPVSVDAPVGVDVQPHHLPATQQRSVKVGAAGCRLRPDAVADQGVAQDLHRPRTHRVVSHEVAAAVAQLDDVGEDLGVRAVGI
jgi:hypothetical protein